MASPRFEAAERIVLIAMRALRIINKIRIPSISNQVSGLKNIQPKTKFATIRNGKKQPVWVTKKRDLDSIQTEIF